MEQIQIENNNPIISASLPVKENKGLFWQVSTILVTEVVFAGAIISIILFALTSIFKSGFQDALNSFPLFKTVIYLCGIVPGLFFGINYVIGKSDVDENRIKSISIWLAGLLVVGYGVDVFGAIQQNGDYIFGLLNLLFIPPTIYFFSRRILSNPEKVKQSFVGRLSVRKLEVVFVSTNIILFSILVLAMADAVFNNNRTILEFLPNGTRQQLEQLINERQTYDKGRLQRVDDIRIEKGQYIVGTLQMDKQINGRYPDLLEDSTAAKIIGEILNPDDLKLDTEYGTALDNFSYQPVNGGQDFKLCIELSTGQKCWNEQGVISPEDTSPSSTPTQSSNSITTPTISRVFPTSVIAGSIVTIYGTNFQPKSRIDIGNALTGVDYKTVYPSSYVDSTTMSFVLPVDTEIGTYDLRIDTFASLAILNVISNPASTLSPSISYGGEFGMYNRGENIMSRGGQAFVFGKGLLENSSVTVVIGSYSASGKVDSGANEVIFFMPDNIPPDSYNLYIVTSTGFKTNAITVTVS